MISCRGPINPIPHGFVILLLLLPGCNKKQTDPNDLIEQKDYQGLQELIETGWDVNSTIQDGGGADTTPLCRACFLGDLEAVKILLSNGADPNKTNKLGFCAVCSLLWNMGTRENNKFNNPNGGDRFYNRDAPEILQLLVEHGANLRKECPHGNAYQTAEFFGNVEAMELIEGFDPSIN